MRDKELDDLLGERALRWALVVCMVVEDRGLEDDREICGV
jgi:hypothetical protein